jgi:hypothetical protein
MSLEEDRSLDYNSLSLCDQSTEEELAFLRAHLAELCPTVLKQLKRENMDEKKRREAEVPAKAKWSGANDPLASPVGAKPAVPGTRLLSPTRPPEPPRPTSWTRPTGAARWNQPPGARRPGQCPGADPRFCLHRQRALPPKTRWVNQPPPGTNKQCLTAGNFAALGWNS